LIEDHRLRPVEVFSLKPLLKISLVLLQDFSWNVLLSIVVVISKFVAQSIRTHIPGSLHLLSKKVRWI